jgi:outer membrane biogenesis lipoprotein LolB
MGSCEYPEMVGPVELIRKWVRGKIAAYSHYLLSEDNEDNVSF